jgi:ubiquinone/menaquinone biosynthesis C-methylase UbiE
MIYGAIASEYATHRHAHAGVVGSLLEFVSTRPGMAVLEVGCGTGNHSGALLSQVSCKCVGVDPSLSMLSEARRRYAALGLTSATAESLPFGDTRFHLVFSVDVIHHVRDRRKAFMEATRVLDAEGAMCTVTETPEIIRTRSVLSTFFPETVAADVGRYPAFDALQSEINDAGLTTYLTENVEQPYVVSDIRPYEARVFSCLRLISDAAFQRGLAALRTALATGPVTGMSRYLAIWARDEEARKCSVARTGG